MARSQKDKPRVTLVSNLPENPGRTHTDTERTYKQHTKEPTPGLKPTTFLMCGGECLPRCRPVFTTTTWKLFLEVDKSVASTVDYE